MRHILLLLSLFSLTLTAKNYDNPDTLIVARDGTGEFRNIDDAIEVCRAYMTYHKVILVKAGTYKEKLVVPHWLTNIEILGEDAERCVITYDDHANIPTAERPKGMGTFRTYTLRIEGSDITLKNITVENNSPRMGQAVALHTMGDRIRVISCRLLGHQDTVFTGEAGTRVLFRDCYIEGTTDFIFGPATAWFENCEIHSRANSYITAASTPEEITYGYVFNHCRLTAEADITRVYLGRPWRDYGYTLFMNCDLGRHIRPEGWHHWKPEREKTARYAEFGNTGDGAKTDNRVAWSRQLRQKEAQKITIEEVFSNKDKGAWKP